VGSICVNEDLLQGFRLGDLRVDPVRRIVTGPAGARHLSPRSVEVLLRLASRPRSVWTRADLLAEVWGDGRGSQESLHHAISDLRHVLDDHPDRPRYIQTLPRQGYRLLVEPVTEAAEAPGAPAPRGDKTGFADAVKRSGVVETGLAYLITGWLVIQVADATFEQLGVPPRFGTLVTVLVIAGFPLAVLIAWLLDVLGRRSGERRRRRRPALNVAGRTAMCIGAAMALAGGGVYVYDNSVGLPLIYAHLLEPGPELASPTPIEPNSIAILRFLNIDGSEETEVFTNGLAEDVMSRLASVPSLRVSSRGDAFSLPPNVSSEAVRARLRVRFYLEGSVRLKDRALRVVIHLINSENGFRVLSRTFSRDRAEFFEVQDEITNLTVASLRVVLPPETQAGPDIYGERTDVDAYVLYRHGMDVLHRPMTATSVEEALGWFRRSLEIDPEFAAAHAGICTAHAEGFNVTSDPGYIAAAENACARAIAHNPNLDVVHSALGGLYVGTGRDREAATAFHRALEINVNSVEAMHGLAEINYRAQRLEDAETMYHRALGLQPGNWVTHYKLGWFLYQNGRYDEAAEQFRKIVSIDPGNMQGYSSLGSSLMLSGNLPDALSALSRAIAIEPRNDTYSNLGLLYYYLGEMHKAVAAHRKAIELAPNDHLAWANLGDALSFTPDKAAARAAFGTAERLADGKLSINPTDAGTLIDLAWIKSMLDKPGEAQRDIARARELTPGDPYVHFVSALVEIRAGDATTVYDDLQAAVAMGYPPKLLAAEPHLRHLRGQPEFAALVGERLAGSKPEK
jgi:tetratricopeptide (TPR) repeat protein/TolB-like protein/DNA-binding winged helix-turn-helix (wHTH) protein